MANHEVVIHFNHSGRSSLLFQGSAEYRARLTQADTLRLYHNYLTIEANRSKVAKDPLQSQNSTIYKQILNSLCLYYILCHRPNHLKSITVSIQRANGTMECITELRSEIRQVISKTCILSSLLNIQPQKAGVILQESDVGRSVLYAATHLIKSLDVQSSVERFERLWRAFNALYRAFARQKTEHDCQRQVRQHIMNNPNLFPHSLASVSSLTTNDIRQNTRWVQMILNNYPAQSNTNSFAASIQRNTDARILEIYRQTLPIRKKFLNNAGQLSSINSHINTSIAANTRCDQDLLSTLSLRYMYFMRNKIAHAEKVDHGFSFLRESTDHAEAVWLAPILESLVIDMINISDTF